jgi:hypothetical protein
VSVYVDDAAILWRSKPRFHLVADNVEELHAFCAAVGIKRCWFHRVPGKPHYDITGPQREAAIAAGAIAVTAQQMVYLTESGRRRLSGLIAESAEDPERQAWYRAILDLVRTSPNDGTPLPGDLLL